MKGPNPPPLPPTDQPSLLLLNYKHHQLHLPPLRQPTQEKNPQTPNENVWNHTGTCKKVSSKAMRCNLRANPAQAIYQNYLFLQIRTILALDLNNSKKLMTERTELLNWRHTLWAWCRTSRLQFSILRALFSKIQHHHFTWYSTWTHKLVLKRTATSQCWSCFSWIGSLHSSGTEKFVHFLTYIT